MMNLTTKYCGLLGYRKQPYLLPPPSPLPHHKVPLVVILGSGYLAREVARPVVRSINCNSLLHLGE